MPQSNRRQQRKIKTRIKLVEAAYEIMSSKGVSDTSIQEITDLADVGFGTFYNYYKTKDALAEHVLDCVIYNLGQRNRLAAKELVKSDPLTVISNSVRLTAREMRTNPMWRWWLKRTDLMVHQMQIGFRGFGVHDIKKAQQDGLVSLPHGNIEIAWSHLIWLLAGTIIDIVNHGHPESREIHMATSIMRVLGVEAKQAIRISKLPLPDLPNLPVDFSFLLDENDIENKKKDSVGSGTA